MRKYLLISLSLVLTLAGWSLASDADFYVIPTMKRNYAPVAKTGQTISADPKDDGGLQKGVAWPIPRFIDNNNGTLTDKLTGLVWLQNANAFGTKTWDQALVEANGLQSGSIPGLTDGSQPGDWRLPNVRELQSLIDVGRINPALPADHMFTNIQLSTYWSSTTIAENSASAWQIHFSDGDFDGNEKTAGGYMWCVRGGQ